MFNPFNKRTKILKSLHQAQEQLENAGVEAYRAELKRIEDENIDWSEYQPDKREALDLEAARAEAENIDWSQIGEPEPPEKNWLDGETL